MNIRNPVLNYEFPGISDATALDLEVDNLHIQLNEVTAQLALERELAMDIHRARSLVVEKSPALGLVFEVDPTDKTKDKSDFTMDDILSSAFQREVPEATLPEGFIDATAKNLRTSHHPDIGGDTNIAQDIAHGLSNVKQDPAFSIASALLAAPRQTNGKSKDKRIKRYQLHIALSASRPQFESEETAKANAELEINSAEWRMRTQAAFKTFELIIGDSDTLIDFLGEIARGQNMYLINMVNRLLPAILSIQERIIKGDPTNLNKEDINIIDEIFERVWSTLGLRNSSIPYSPPYLNWFEILLPAMELLDPGEKPGQTYTHFEKPIQVRPTSRISSGMVEKETLDYKQLIRYDNENNKNNY